MNHPPKVFISYSWDSEAHKERVLDLANRLRAEGIDCQLDQYEVSPPQGWARWMNEQIEQADYVLAICTETYKRRATGQEEPDKGLGVTWEGMLVGDQIYQNRALNRKFIPILYSLDDKTHIPSFLGTVSFYVLDTGYEKLYRHLTDQPETVKPELGKLTPLPPKSKASQPDPAKFLPEKASPLDIPHPKDPIPPDSPFYVERDSVESTCYSAIVKPGALINIKAPRYMGKTSLLNWILDHAASKQPDYRKVTVNFLATDSDSLASVDNFLQWFCRRVTAELQLPDKVATSWKSKTSVTKQKCTNYFAKYLLSQITLLGLDNIDRIFRYPDIAEGFFTLLRLWHEDGQNQAKWKNLRLVTVYSKEPLTFSDMNKSPFNVGVPIELAEWTSSQVQDLAKRHGHWEATQVKQLMDMVGGHPYLVREALYQVAKQQMTLEELLKLAPTLEGPYRDHLLRYKSFLEEKDNLNLRVALKQVVNASSPVRLETKEESKLCSKGLVKFQGDGVIPLCNLYREYFKKVL